MTRKADGFESVGAIVKRHPELKQPSHTQLRLIESAIDIASGDERSPNYQHSVLCQTSLPYRRSDERVHERRNGRTILRVEAGTAYNEEKDAWIELPVPFGPKARLVLIHLNTAAIITQSPEIDVGDSMTDFFSRVLADPRKRYRQPRELNGREIRAMKEQVSALAAANIRFAVGGSVQKQGNATIISEFDLWFPKNANQRVLWPSTVTLSLDYFASLQNHAVPLDPAAIAGLANSALGLDVYTWLAQRLCRIPANADAFVPWAALHGQFGQGYSNIRKFRQVFLSTLKFVQKVYPKALVRFNHEGLYLKLSPPPIERKQLLAQS